MHVPVAGLSLIPIVLVFTSCAKSAEFGEGFAGEGSDDARAGAPSDGVAGRSSSSTGGRRASATGGTSDGSGGSPSSNGGTATGSGGTATAATCDDGLKNGSERGVDCGGPCEKSACELGAACSGEADCADAPCVDGICSLCADGEVSPGETDVDCGGALCEACAETQACASHGDCVTRSCVDGVCGPPSSCLVVMPAECACNPTNASDIEACQGVLECYIENSCSPSTCSQSRDDVCGSNTLKTHDDPMVAAAASYDCACGEDA